MNKKRYYKIQHNPIFVLQTHQMPLFIENLANYMITKSEYVQ